MRPPIARAEATPCPEGGRVLRVLAHPAFRRRELNPYNWQLSTSLQAAGVRVDEFSRRAMLLGQHDIWHLHWPESHLNERLALACRRSAGFPLLLALARARGTSIVWTVHNLRAHEQRHPRLERWFRRAFLPQVDGVISLSKSGDDAAAERFPSLRDVPRFVIPHGHYRDVYPNVVTRSEARTRLGISEGARVIGFVGLIRAYKNVARLISAGRLLPDEDLILLIAGRPASPALEAEIRAAAGTDPRVRLHLGLIAEQDMQVYLTASDVMVLPYREILNSGSALLSLSFDRPVVVPAAGALPELQACVGGEWVRLYPGALGPGVLQDALRWARETPRPAKAPLDAYEWSAIGAATVGAYQTIVDARSRRRLVGRAATDRASSR